MAAPASAAPASGRYAGKVAIVTGAAKGIGRAIATEFAAQGASVVVADIDRERGQDLVATLKSNGWQAHFVPCNLCEDDDLRHLVAATQETFGRIDCLVNNGGAHPPAKPIDDFDRQALLDIMNLNFTSAFCLTRYALPALRQTQGNVINLSSLVAEQGQLLASTYAASKGALTSFSKALAVEEARHHVRVNVVAPGNVWTPMWREACPEDQDGLNEAYAVACQQQVLGRFGAPAEVARMCLFIASEATFSTGQVFYFTGGAELGYGAKLDVPKGQVPGDAGHVL